MKQNQLSNYFYAIAIAFIFANTISISSQYKEFFGIYGYFFAFLNAVLCTTIGIGLRDVDFLTFLFSGFQKTTKHQAEEISLWAVERILTAGVLLSIYTLNLYFCSETFSSYNFLIPGIPVKANVVLSLFVLFGSDLFVILGFKSSTTTL